LRSIASVGFEKKNGIGSPSADTATGGENVLPPSVDAA
jgi:hypothetical protein